MAYCIITRIGQHAETNASMAAHSEREFGIDQSLDKDWWRKTLGFRLFKHMQWWNQAIDYWAYLDAQGKVGYRNLW